MEIPSNTDTPKQAIEKLVRSAVETSAIGRQERRNYALLQAAATVLRGLVISGHQEGNQIKTAVDAAKRMLEEIEKP